MGAQLVTPESICAFVAVAAGSSPPSSAPVLSLVSYTDTTINVSCTSVSGATGYKFYRDGTLVATQAGTTYQYTGLTSHTSYALTCKAYNGGGDSSASNTINRTTEYTYPTLSDTSKQIIWVDFLNMSKTDTSGIVQAVAGDSIWTVKLPSGWGSASGDGLVRQDTSGNRPTLQSTGAQGNGTSTIMSLPAVISFTGTFTIYGVYSRTASNKICWFFTNSGNNGCAGSFSDGVFYVVNSSGNNGSLADSSSSSMLVKRWRRTSSLWALKITGVSEVTAAKDANTYGWNSMFKRSSDTTDSGCRLVAAIAVNEDVVATGNNTVIENFISSAYGVSV